MKNYEDLKRAYDKGFDTGFIAGLAASSLIMLSTVTFTAVF